MISRLIRCLCALLRYNTVQITTCRIVITTCFFWRCRQATRLMVYLDLIKIRRGSKRWTLEVIVHEGCVGAFSRSITMAFSMRTPLVRSSQSPPCCSVYIHTMIQFFQRFRGKPGIRKHASQDRGQSALCTVVTNRHHSAAAARISNNVIQEYEALPRPAATLNHPA